MKCCYHSQFQIGSSHFHTKSLLVWSQVRQFQREKRFGFKTKRDVIKSEVSLFIKLWSEKMWWTNCDRTQYFFLVRTNMALPFKNQIHSLLCTFKICLTVPSTRLSIRNKKVFDIFLFALKWSITSSAVSEQSVIIQSH